MIRKIISFLAMLILAVSVMSCIKEEGNANDVKRISVNLEDTDVKTALNAAHTSIEWSEGDCIGIFHNAGAGNMQNASLEYRRTGDMTVTVPAAADRIFGVYPFDASMGADPAQAVISIPSSQRQTHPGQTDGKNFPLAASGEISDGNVRLAFSPLASMLALNIYSTSADGTEAVSQITVTPTENTGYAGRQTTDLTTDTPSFILGTLSSGITLTVDNPQPLDDSRPADSDLQSYPKQLYISIARQSYTYMNIKVTTTSGNVYSMQTNGTPLDCTKDDIMLLNVNLATKAVSRVILTGTEDLIEVRENDITNLAFEDVVIQDASKQASEMTCPQDMDFSRVGYHWGDDDIPCYPAHGAVLTPSGGDDYDMIQGAIDNYSGSGEAIVLGPGTFKVSKTISLWKPGLVLRGTKDGDRLATTIFKTGTSSEDVINVGGKTYSKVLDMSCSGRITDPHTPVGAMWVNVENADRFNPGDRVCICRYPNEKWIKDIRMTTEDGLKFGWIPSDFYTQWERVVIKVEGSRVYLDNPVVMAIDDIYGGGYLVRCHSTGCISESGVEDLVIDCEYDSSVRQNDYYSFYMDIESDEAHAHTAVKFTGAEHCWAVNIESHHMYFACVQFGTACTHCTALSCRYMEPVSTITGSRRYAFSIGNGQLCLVKNCSADQARHSYITTGDNPGPNVFTQSSGTNSFAETGPHNKWSTGTLYDHLVLTGWGYGTSSPTPGTTYTGSTDRWHGLLRIQDAFNYGATDSQGWTGANLVFWNCESEIYVCENPWVTSRNWAWGCTGVYKIGSNSATAAEGRDQGDIYSDGEHIILDGYTSLYEYQLNRRHSEGIRHFVPGFSYNY